MRISEIVSFQSGTPNQQAVLSKYQPGREAEFLFPDGTKITKDLKINPNVFGKDKTGKVIANIASPTDKIDQQLNQPVDKQLVPGSKININLANRPV